MSLNVMVRFYVGLEEKQVQRIDIINGSKVIDLLRQLEVQIEEVNIISINGAQATLDTKLQNNDQISLIPPMGGG